MGGEEVKTGNTLKEELGNIHVKQHAGTGGQCCCLLLLFFGLFRFFLTVVIGFLSNVRREGKRKKENIAENTETRY